MISCPAPEPVLTSRQKSWQPPLPVLPSLQQTLFSLSTPPQSQLHPTQLYVRLAPHHLAQGRLHMHLQLQQSTR